MSRRPIHALVVPGDTSGRVLRELSGGEADEVRLELLDRVSALERIAAGEADVVLLDAAYAADAGAFRLAAPLLAVVLHAGDADGGLHLLPITGGHPKRVDRHHSLAAALREAIGEAGPDLSLYQLEREARQAAEALARRCRLLAEASQVLVSSLDIDATLGALANLVARELGHGCTIDLTERDGTLRRLTAIAPRDVELLVPAAFEAVPPLSDTTHPIVEAIDLRAPIGGRDGESAWLVVPLVARQAALGTLSLFDRRFEPDDVSLAEELAGRAALAVDNGRLHHETLRLYEEAQAAARARDHVLAVVSHDLRNPLTIITMAASQLLRPMTAEKQRAQALKVDVASRRMARLIEDLLDVTRIEAGALSLARERQRPSEVLAQAAELLRPLADARGIVLETICEEGLFEVDADPHRLQQVLANLGGNALKFTPARGRVALCALSDGRGVRFSVADTGPGIPRELQDKIFDRFWQARKADREGAGLGLAICKGIVEAHGATLRIESEVGRGTAFSFTLAAAVDEARALAG